MPEKAGFYDHKLIEFLKENYYDRLSDLSFLGIRGGIAYKFGDDTIMSFESADGVTVVEGSFNPFEPKATFGPSNDINLSEKRVLDSRI